MLFGYKTIEDVLEEIKNEFKRNEFRITYLSEENRKLKEEYSKEKEIQNMQERLDKMKKDYRRGFPRKKKQL